MGGPHPLDAWAATPGGFPSLENSRIFWSPYLIQFLTEPFAKFGVQRSIRIHNLWNFAKGLTIQLQIQD